MRISDWSSDVCSSDLIGDARGVVLAAILLVWAVLYVTKGRFLKSPAERIATRLTGREVKVTGDFQLYFNTFKIKFMAEGIMVANTTWAEGRHIFSEKLLDSLIATVPLLGGGIGRGKGRERG